ncbi:Myb DNA-bind 3 domain-containing protein [Abeliophyllum distichum]|uniref:Myb DNA-bind 3 domain-containing protein n=1 Tax=Abeliophyllum distichum TaxID=126358 RepID=A0ABD1VSC8_9LAMI
MGGHRGKTKEPMSWSDENEHTFSGILYDNVKSGKLQCSTFTKDEWSKINSDMIVVTKSDYGINKTEYRIFRKEGCKHYELLGEIFGGTTATSGLGNASTTLPPTSEEERQLEDDFLSRGAHVHVENDDNEEVTNTRRRDDHTSNERRRKEPKISKSGKLEACMTQWSSTISMTNDEIILNSKQVIRIELS